MEVTYFWIGITVLLLLLDLWVLNSVWRSDHRHATKAMWTALVVVLPVVGLVIWAVAGPRGVTKGPSSPEHSKG